VPWMGALTENQSGPGKDFPTAACLESSSDWQTEQLMEYRMVPTKDSEIKLKNLVGCSAGGDVDGVI